ncbi:hypothetical protein QCE63_04925 [Caballeronia sp. LZ065]|uniref:hypothetical protein n=1 Tax=Caballeronia sp. LZ065 TaxID=3038571 RepID=UPI00285FC21F|nr:hypothetical protein [Caballeronia sp. LZ065]MDR5778774.1 hypothetical protein [Caballeronia sp. LZ065]
MRDALKLQEELLTLTKADVDIEQAKERIKQQELILRKLDGAGDDREDAEELLATFNDALQAMELHRTAIVHEIERLRREA